MRRSSPKLVADLLPAEDLSGGDDDGGPRSRARAGARAARVSDLLAEFDDRPSDMPGSRAQAPPEDGRGRAAATFDLPDDLLQELDAVAGAHPGPAGIDPASTLVERALRRELARLKRSAR